MTEIIDQLILHGVGASPGILIGKAYVYGRSTTVITETAITPQQVEAQSKRFDAALKETKEQIEALQSQISSKLQENQLQIFDSHLTLVDDPAIRHDVMAIVSEKLVNVEFAFREVLDKFTETMMQIDDPYLRDRVTDINDVGDRILRNLCGIQEERLEELPDKRILVAEQITPSEIIHMDKRNVTGFITEDGSKTSHSAIMANSLNIPAVVGLKGALLHISTGDLLIVNGESGEVLVNPDESTLAEYETLLEEKLRLRRELETRLHLPCETRDGFRIEIAANIEHPTDVDKLKKYADVGVGLFRTEYLFMDTGTAPSEEEQFEAYRYAAENISPNPVIIRTADLGGDKFLQNYNKQERNPFLGVRGIRLSLAQKDLFRSQLRAILRASNFGKVKIMFPLVSSVEEISSAIDILNQTKSELTAEGIPFAEEIEVGMMMEVPSAGVIADRMINYVDFFSIGTNDLVQYLLAVDRVNENLAHLYQPTHPSILRMIHYVVKAARAKGKWVGLCGEVSSDTTLTPLLLGLGLQELSMSPPAIPRVKDMIRSLKMHEAERLAQKAMNCDSGPEVLKLCKELQQRIKEG